MAGGVRKEVRVVVMGMSIEPVAEAREAGGTEPSCAVHTWEPAPPLSNGAASRSCYGSTSLILNEIVVKIRSDTCNVCSMTGPKKAFNK